MSRPQGYFIFDSHSRNELGLLDPSNGKSCLLKFDNVFELEKYIQFFYLRQMEKNSTYFEIQFIQIDELKEELRDILQRDFSVFMRNPSKKRKNDGGDGNDSSSKRKKTHKESNQAWYKKNKETIIENNKIYRSQNKEKMTEKRKIHRSQNKEKIKEKERINRTKNKEKINEKDKIYHQNNKDQIAKRKKSNYEKNKNSKDDLVSKFLKLIYEGPFYICVSCNRCLYRKTVVKYSPEKYDMPQEYYYS